MRGPRQIENMATMAPCMARLAALEAWVRTLEVGAEDADLALLGTGGPQCAEVIVRVARAVLCYPAPWDPSVSLCLFLSPQPRRVHAGSHAGPWKRKR